DLVSRLAERGIAVQELLLHVGLDTFRPIAVEEPASHRMHSEWYEVPATVQQAIAGTRAAGRRVVAVGTTAVRALESWAATGEAEGWTDLFITPGLSLRGVGALVTHFHLPRSTA